MPLSLAPTTDRRRPTPDARLPTPNSRLPTPVLMINLQGHAALITGSTKGVGRSIAEAFAAAGANVVIHGRRRDRAAEEVLVICGGRGVKIAFVAADLMAETIPVVDRLFADVIAAMPGVDILVNNAG